MEITTVDGKKVLVNVLHSDIQQGRVNVPEDVQYIKGWAFYNLDGNLTDLTQVTLPISLTCIGTSTFAHCTNLTQLTLHNNLTYIGAHAFDGTGLTQITLPEGLTHIALYTFNNCIRLIQITLPDSLTHIDLGAFHNCRSLTQLTLPKSLIDIGAFAFESCSGLTQITIPESITHIGEGAFLGCTNLTNIIIDTDDANEFVRLKNLLPENLRVHARPRSIEALQKKIVAQFCAETMLYDLQHKLKNNTLDLLVKAVITDYLDKNIPESPEAVQFKNALQAIRPIPGLPHQQQEMDAYESLLEVERKKHIMQLTVKRLQKYVNTVDAQIRTALAARGTLFAALSSSSVTSAQAVLQPRKPTNIKYKTLQKLILELQQGNIPALSDEEKQALQTNTLLKLMSPIIKLLGMTDLPKTSLGLITPKESSALLEGTPARSSSAASEATTDDLSDSAAKKQKVRIGKRPLEPTLFNTAPKETSAPQTSLSRVAAGTAGDVSDSAAKRRKVSKDNSL